MRACNGSQPFHVDLMRKGVPQGFQSGNELFFKSRALLERVEGIKAEHQSFENCTVVLPLHAGKCLHRYLEPGVIEVVVYVLPHFCLI